jgi:hypothetical protein
MTVTAFGGLFLPLSLFVFLFRRGWLLPLLCVAAVLQSPSVINVPWRGELHGITPFLAVSALVAADLLLRVRRSGLTLGTGGQGRLLRLWLAFGAVAALGALLLPWVFAGVEVLRPLDKAGIEGAPVALAWSINHLAQVANLGAILVAMLWIVQQRDEPLLERRVWIGVVAALAASASIGLQQRLGWNGLVPLWDAFWASNPTYAQNFRSWVGAVPRVSWPWVEASYGSVWYAAVFGGFAAMFIANQRRNPALLGAIVALFALANSLGGAGALVLALFVGLASVAVVVAAALRPDWRGGLFYRSVLASLVAACLALAFYLVVRHYGTLPEALAASRGLADQLRVLLFGSARSQADAQALVLLSQTWGLGAGMGSHRGSSYLFTLLGNTGVAGTLLFLVAIGYQFRLLVERWRRRPGPSAVFFFGSGTAVLLGVAFAVPDQNWPAFWILMFGGLACAGLERPARRPAADAP